MKRVILWVVLAMLMVPALRLPAHALDVRAINQEIARLRGELREMEHKIVEIESISQESQRALRHWIEITEQAKREHAEAQRLGGPVHEAVPYVTIKPLEFFADRAIRSNPFVVRGGGGATIKNHAELMSYADFLRKQHPNARQDIEILQARHREGIAELERLQWHLVAAGVGEDPILGSWKLVLGTAGTVVTVRKAPDGQQYIGVIEVSTLEHFPQGAALFSVIIDLNKPYNYTGIQYGYTSGRRDAREDEPLRIEVRGSVIHYDNRQQKLMWQRFGDKPASPTSMPSLPPTVEPDHRTLLPPIWSTTPAASNNRSPLTSPTPTGPTRPN